MAEIDRVRRQEDVPLRSRSSSGLIVGGGVLLLMDFLVVWFTYVSVKDGSYFWAAVQSVIGPAAILGGALRRSRHVS